MTKGEYELLKFYTNKGTRVEEVFLDRMIRIEHILRHALSRKDISPQEFRSEVQRAHDMADDTLNQLLAHITKEKGE